MRRLSNLKTEERGAASVIVAILMVALLGFAALVIDVGLMYAEKAQLQNGADAAALSIAQTCAMDGALDCNEVAATSMAKDLAEGNANDGLAHIQDVAITGGTVRVTTGALEAGGEANQVSLYFAQALGISSAEVGAVAEAAWGGHSKDSAPFAIAFSKCEVDSGPVVDGSLQFLRSHGVDDTDGGCHPTSSGAEIPGGFGWLDQTVEGSCSVDVDLADPMIGSDVGSNLKSGCSERLDEWEAKLSAGSPLIELFPVFDSTNGETGSNGAFHLHAFVAFDVRGWNFAGGNEYMLPEAKTLFDATYNKGTDRGFIGKFVRYVSLDEAGDFGGSTEYGAKTVTLTE